MIRVLVIAPGGGLWGSERALLDLVDSVKTVDFVVCCSPGTPMLAEFERRGIRAFPYFIELLHKKTRWHRLKAALGILRACLKFRPEVIYLNQSGCYRVVLVSAILLRLPIVAHVRIFEDAPYLGARRFTGQVRGIIAISKAIETAILRHPTLRGIPVHLLYDAYIFSHDWQQHAAIERMPNRVAYAGRIVPNKGVDLLLSAMDVLADSDLGVECIIVGDGEPAYVEWLKDISSRGRSAAGSIAWLGVRNDVLPLMRSCSILAVPSHNEALGRVIFEAWDAGTVPVACVTGGGAAEVIRAADGGILYEEQTPRSLANAIRRALDLSQPERDRLISNGRAWLANNASPESYGPPFATILTEPRSADPRVE